MKACLAVIVTIGVQAVAFAQSTNPLTAGARLHYGIIKDSVTRAAVKTPEEFRPHLSHRLGRTSRRNNGCLLVFSAMTDTS